MSGAIKKLFTPQIPSKNISLALPGITKQARDTVAEVLEENHYKYHCFFNERGFHTHLAHGVLAGYSLGASPNRLRAIYESHAADQRPIGSVQKSFTTSDWRSELGERDFYASYLEFFRSEVQRLGRVDAVVKYAFDSDTIGRTFSGAFHPLIHIGYGFDFEIDATVAEGLAMMAVTSALMAPFIVHPAGVVEKITSKVAAQLSISKSSTPKTVVEILKAIQDDRELDDVAAYPMPSKTMEVVKHEKVASKIQHYLSGWDVEGKSLIRMTQDIDAKSKELYRACVLAVGGTGLRSGKSHFGAALVYYISRGRPAIDVDALVNYRGKQQLDSTNPWLSLIKRAVEIDEVHATKVVRSCALGDLLFGAEESYSQLCVNTAQIALDLQGDWEFEGVGWAETWEN
ncbi:hypothetical protein BGZ58_003435 [Dissophora ornata]|nr:hypothetical protein BGZ58_003435 [Dissophora ornata]